ncbi:LysR family transcriptional regulator [Nocardia vinacea]|uniref:LysR family transcriptional regulator n=1 Tax=Nocardia vinacea TaxID=96468 RepID=UPI002E115223|nr:LysR family transcriptional regulator [Nocardia vinacea]
MQLRELEWFISLTETGNMTSTAEQLNISQPTLSRALARIERRLGVELFDRHQNRLRLNKYGEVFRAHAVRAVDEINQGEERIATLVDPDRGVVSIGFLHSFGGWLIPRLLDGYRVFAPRTSFELCGGAADAIVDDVRHGRIDIGFVAPRPNADDLRWLSLGREELGLGVPPGHPLEGRADIAVADLVDEPMVALEVGYGLRQVTDRLCREAGFTPRIVIEVTELSTLRALVTAGMGVAVIPTAWPGHTLATPTIPFRDRSISRQYGAVTRAHGPSGQAAQRFLEFVAEQSRSQPDTSR